MKKLALVLLPALAAGCVAESPRTVEMSAATQASLSAAIAGRTAGQPVACINDRNVRGPRSAGAGVLVFDASPSLIYVNRTRGDCGDLRLNRSVQFSRTGSQLCRGDVASTVDPYNGIQGNFCTLGDFQPYRR